MQIQPLPYKTVILKGDLLDCRTPDLPNEKPFIRTWSVRRLVGWLQRWAETNVTLAFEDAQVIPPLSREDTDDTDDTDDTENLLRTF